MEAGVVMANTDGMAIETTGRMVQFRKPVVVPIWSESQIQVQDGTISSSIERNLLGEDRRCHGRYGLIFQFFKQSQKS